MHIRHLARKWSGSILTPGIHMGALAISLYNNSLGQYIFSDDCLGGIGEFSELLYAQPTLFSFVVFRCFFVLVCWPVYVVLALANF